MADMQPSIPLPRESQEDITFALVTAARSLDLEHQAYHARGDSGGFNDALRLRLGDDTRRALTRVIVANYPRNEAGEFHPDAALVYGGIVTGLAVGRKALAATSLADEYEDDLSRNLLLLDKLNRRSGEESRYDLELLLKMTGSGLVDQLRAQQPLRLFEPYGKKSKASVERVNGVHASAIGYALRGAVDLLVVDAMKRHQIKDPGARTSLLAEADFIAKEVDSELTDLEGSLDTPTHYEDAEQEHIIPSAVTRQLGNQ